MIDPRIGVSPDDPAFSHIARALAELKLRFGFDTDDPTVQARAIEAGRRQFAADQAAAPAPRPLPVVYYVRIGKLIKIGMSSQLDTRLRAYPPDAVLLATEPGGRRVEAQRHRQFRDTAATPQGEYFHPSLALIEHINSLRQEPLTAAELAA